MITHHPCAAGSAQGKRERACTAFPNTGPGVQNQGQHTVLTAIDVVWVQAVPVALEGHPTNLLLADAALARIIISFLN
jgi:hypothetical protein